MTFDDDALFDSGGEAEEPESPRRGSERQPQTPRASRVNVIQDGDDESVPRARSKGKEKATNQSRRGRDVEVEEEIAQGLEDVDMQQGDEDDEVTSKKKPTEKRSRKKRALPDVTCKSPFTLAQPSS